MNSCGFHGFRKCLFSQEQRIPSSGTRELNYIDIPVMLQYRFNEKFRISAGPQISILTSASDIFDAQISGEDKLIYNDDLESELISTMMSFSKL